MSTEAEREITLTQQSGLWKAVDEGTGIEVLMESREKALEALDRLVETRNCADDAFFLASSFTTDENNGDVSANVDEYLNEAE